ncbi:MAG: rhomboid family intramembrane serine protease [Marinilabiliaceae bacterium]|jgi:membrane associated rhomboid family serine protease|nr:rhomboid family intramembrane serine protease [Marinilabiliaceae bacterium]
MNLLDEIKKQFSSGSNLMKIIYINSAVFLLLAVVKIITFLLQVPGLSDKILGFLAVPAAFDDLLRKPWTILTYMFLHEGFLHLLFNMLWLYWFSTIFLHYFNHKKLLNLYIMGGLAGAILYIISFNLFPAFSEVIHVSIAMGASASVMAIVVATAAYVPNYQVRMFLIGTVPIKYIAIGILLLTSVFDFSVNTGGKIAHLGGALMGFVYAGRLRKGTDIGSWVSSIIDYFVTLFRPRKEMKVTYRRPVSDYDYNKSKADNQKQLDRILEKISKGGYESLSKEEKELLFKESNKKN